MQTFPIPNPEVNIIISPDLQIDALSLIFNLAHAERPQSVEKRLRNGPEKYKPFIACRFPLSITPRSRHASACGREIARVQRGAFWVWVARRRGVQFRGLLAMTTLGSGEKTACYPKTLHDMKVLHI
ncbi:hypothetical protein PoB_004925200 [Plakobranchus ocellatus]|uniref:Uncharacterized protein n=1 Tax=Plakobranchus ocellatus TaxID=259542 RepID=A0AAV4BTL4_9GAST|nr:hypothetical protein PoB_004925200 [Plakobranchus ocellatus]